MPHVVSCLTPLCSSIPTALQSHPAQSEGIRDALRSGALTPRPGIARLDGHDVVFTDGSRVAADLIVWATGYRVSFPFLDGLLTVRDNDLPLFKRVVHPDLPGLYFVGLLQAVGAVMPLAEAQSCWIADLVRGAALPPPDGVIRARLARDDRDAKRHFYRSPRHTMEVDFDHYRWDLRREHRRGRRRAAAAAAGQRRAPPHHRGVRPGDARPGRCTRSAAGSGRWPPAAPSRAPSSPRSGRRRTAA